MIDKFFKHKMPVVRFRADENLAVDVEELRANLLVHQFRDEPGFPVVVGFTDFKNAYGEEQEFPIPAHHHGDYFVALFRIDKRNIPASTVKLRVAKRCQEFLQETGRTFVPREMKKDFANRVKEHLLSVTPPKTTFIPFAVNVKNGSGFFFSTSNSDFQQFAGLFSKTYGDDFVRCELFGHMVFDEQGMHYDEIFAPDALTYLWWDTESNSFIDMRLGKREVKTFIGDRVSVSTSEQKIAASGQIEEAKLAIAKGADVSKIELLVHIGDDERKFVVSAGGDVSGLWYSPDVLPSDKNDESFVLPFIAATQDIFDLLDLWKDRYLAAYENGSGLTPKIRETWGRGEYCSRAFDDV